ncbi:hypothetical protein EDB19DRAFT_309780 [Suillus lakei]|nr:hypothetical protein EDB19DRAFT_309780 [Suillus lakei]
MSKSAANVDFAIQRTLISLSSEIISRTLLNLDWRGLLTCRLVCKALRSRVDENPAAQYIIELAVTGMEDGTQSQLTAASKLALLKERNACWEALKWGETRDLPLLQGDIIWELCGGVFAQSRLPGALRLYRLPSRYRNIPPSSWKIPLLSDTKDFTMDPAQDLLVLIDKPVLIPTHNDTKSKIRIQIHLRSMTTGRVHPSVIDTVRVINHDLDMRSTQMDLSLQVSGDLLGVLFVGHGNNAPELAVWNWKTGALVLTRSSREIATFVFLTSHLLLVGTVMNEFEVTEPRLFVVDVSKPSTNKVTLTADYVCAFGFPSFDLVVSPIAILIRSDPSPEWMPNPEAHVPFSIARGHRLFLITTWIEEKRNKASYDLFAPADIILSHVAALPRRAGRHVIKWDEWGPTGTRFLKSPPHSHVWTGYVFGSKFVSLVTSPKATTGRQSQTLEVWDFNQLAMKRAATLGFEKENVRHVYDATIVKDKVFVETIRTSLPYSVTTRTLPSPRSPEEPTFTDAMCSEDTIFLVNQSDRRHLRVLPF